MPNISDAGSAGRAHVGEQLDLFLDAAAARGLTDLRCVPLRPEQARAAISPAWWPIVAPLFTRDAGLTVQRCHEQDGELVIEVVDTNQRDDEGHSPERILARLRARAASTCGCCGAHDGRTVRLRIDEPTRRVCHACEGRLRAGEAYLSIADEFWRLDGSPRYQSVATALPPVRAARVAPAPTQSRAVGELPPAELRAVAREIRRQIASEVVGHCDAVARLSLLGALHVGGGLRRGGRGLLIGPSGAGKTALLSALRRALAPWGLPWVEFDAISITSPGWSGAATIGALIEEALGTEPPDSILAQHAVVCVDELHHVGVVRGLHGNMEAKRREVLSSLLGLAGHGAVLLGESATRWSSRAALVIGCGAFTSLLDLTRPLTTRDLADSGGIPVELATRLAEELIVIHELREPELVTLLRGWPALNSLVDVCARLGYAVRIVDEAFTRAARVITLGQDGSTARTAGGWLVSALRHALIAALDDPDQREIVVTPDTLPIPSTATRRRPPDSSPDEGDPAKGVD
ncbi:MAG TPA: ATP-binding protein [Gemmatimonadaceae bacterium]|nr:ATP-binding protein [Gemmatimonadaceae bacterium]